MNSIKIQAILEILFGKILSKTSSLAKTLNELEPVIKKLEVAKRKFRNAITEQSQELAVQIQSLKELQKIIQQFASTHQISNEQRAKLTSVLTKTFVDMVKKGELGACELENYTSSHFRAADVTFMLRGKNGEILNKDEIAQLSDEEILTQIRIDLCKYTAKGTFKAVFASKLRLQYEDGQWTSTPIKVKEKEALCITDPKAHLPELTEKKKKIRNQFIGRTTENPGIFYLPGATIEPYLLDATVANFLIKNFKSKIVDKAEFNIKVGLNLMAEITSLHTEGYLHGDINTRNIFITLLGEVTLCDFDTLKAFDTTTGFQGSLEFTPIELLKQYFKGEKISPSPMQDIYGLIITSLLLQEGDSNGVLTEAFKNYLKALSPLEMKLRDKRIKAEELKKIFSDICAEADKFQHILITYLENSQEQLYHKAYLAALNNMNTKALDVVQLMLEEPEAKALLNSDPAMEERFEQLLTKASVAPPSILPEEQVSSPISKIITPESMSTPPRMKNSQEDVPEARRASSEPVRLLPVHRRNFFGCSPNRGAIGRASSLSELTDCSSWINNNEAVVKTEQSFFREAVQNNSDSGVQQVPQRKVIKRAISLWAFSADSVSPNKDSSVVCTYKR